MNCWVPTVTLVHDDIDSSILEGVNDSLYSYWGFRWQKRIFSTNTEHAKFPFQLQIGLKICLFSKLENFILLIKFSL